MHPLTAPSCPCPTPPPHPHPHLQAARAKCVAWPACQAFVYLPLGLENFTQAPVAQFKGSSDGSPIDINLSSLSALSVAYIKEGQLAVSPTPARPARGTRSYLSSGGWTIQRGDSR